MGSRCIARATLLASLVSAGCSDQVVGYFGEGSETTAVLPDPTTSGAADSASGSEASESGSSGGVGFMAPGCFSDDFEDGVVDEAIWNTWIESDAQLEEVGGQLKFTPPTTGVLDTGIVGNYLHVFDFEAGWVRMQVTIPPDPARPSVLFLMIGDDPRSIAMNLSGGEISMWAREDMVEAFSQSVPMDPYPGWIGIRAEGGEVFFEVSEDGVAWEVLASFPQPWTQPAATTLVMSQTYGQDPAPLTVAVDNIEVCVQ